METRELSKLEKRLNFLLVFLNKLKSIRNRLNKRMEDKYSPTLIALFTTMIAFAVAVLMLFLPNYLGVADDGSLSEVMSAADVYYMQEEVSDIYNNYFIKTYSRLQNSEYQSGNEVSSQILLVKAAVFIDDEITRDKFFDIRFLALLYLIFYLPAFYLLIRQACGRVKRFSEGIVIAIAGLLMFSDVAYLTYFNSFYPEAIWLISLLYCVGLAMSFQNERSGYRDFGFLLLFLLSASILVTSKWQCAFIGIIIAVFCLKLAFIRRHWIWVSTCVMASLYLSILAMVSMITLNNEFDDTSKFHAMTRGVLFQSENPQEALSEFGIAPSYELLADASTYDYIPFVRAGDSSLQEGFMDKYTTFDIGTYYLRHPGDLLAMIDVSIKSNFAIRREYCSNYEKNVGMPERARSIFWSAWSTFKINSAPKTVGYLIVLIAAIILLFAKGYTLRPTTERRNTVLLDVLIMVLFIVLSQSVITIIYSGDAEMIQHCFLVSLGIDVLTYVAFAEVVHKLNIF